MPTDETDHDAIIITLKVDQLKVKQQARA